MVALLRGALSDAVRAGEFGPEVDTDEALLLLSMLTSGAVTRTFANEPGVRWEDGRFASLFGRLLELLPVVYPPR